MDHPPPEEVLLDYHEHDETGADDITAAQSVEALLIVLILIGLTILFEEVKHHAEHAAGRALRPIVKALFGELTVLGFLSMVTFCLQKAGAFDVLSRLVYPIEEEEKPEEEENEVFEMVETIHFGMFFIMVVFLVQVLAEVHDGLQAQSEWCQWDRACHDEAYVETLLKKNAEMDEEFDATSSMGGVGGTAKRLWRGVLPYLRFLPFLRDKKREGLEDKMEFISLRIEFFKERSVDPPFSPAGDEEGGALKTMGDHFNFGRYLTHAYAKKMTAVIEIDIKTWLLFAGGAVCYFALFGVLGYSLETLAWVWVLMGWIFHVLAVQFEKYLLGIRDRFLAPQFVPQPRLRQLSWNNLGSACDDDFVGTEKEPLKQSQQQQGENLPMWCHIDLDELDRKRSPLAKSLFGPTPQNRQHALYLFGPDGPAFHILCLRVMLVFSCIYTSQLVILFVPEVTKAKGMYTLAFIAYCFLAAVPALAFIFNKKRLIASFIQVGCIGTFVLPQAVSESEREEKTSTAVRVLVIYFKLARTVQEFLANPSNKESEWTSGHFTNVFAVEEVSELGRIFNKYLDHDGDGRWNTTEFQGLMATVGVAMTTEEASQILRVLEKNSAGRNRSKRPSMEQYLSVNLSEYEEEIPAQSPQDFDGVPKQVFFQWYANQLGGTDDRKECADFWFRLFDEDGSGDITVLEFKQSLDKLAIGISHDEADELIEELDQDANGVLCEDEFHEMMENFWPLEFENYGG